MDTKICLDTDIAIGIINGDKRLESLISKLPDYDICITSITVFELLLRETKLDIAKRFVNDSEIIHFKEREAIISSSIFKDLKRKGSIIEIRDIFIASSCIANNLPLATLNKKHFERIKELRLVKMDSSLHNP